MGGDGGRVAIHDDSADFTWSWAIREMSRYYGKCHAIMEKKIHNRQATIFQMLSLIDDYNHIISNLIVN
jgi:hypothetical protein